MLPIRISSEQFMHIHYDDILVFGKGVLKASLSRSSVQWQSAMRLSPPFKAKDTVYRSYPPPTC